MSDPIQVLITTAFLESQLDKLRSVSPRLKFEVRPVTSTEEISDEKWKKVEVLYTSRVLPPPEKVPNLRWIQFHWAGIDHAIDAPVLRKPELVATTLSGAAASQMGEYVLMMLLALSHRLPALLNSQRKAEWPENRWDLFMPLELRDSKVGILGYGSIGRQVARLLFPFRAKVLATKRDVMHPHDNGYTPDGLGDPEGEFVHRLYPPEALRSMLQECDFVVVTLPLTHETENLIGEEELQALKPSAYIIDLSRGGIIDHSALIPALKEKRIAGAALDVFPEEPLPPENPLWKLPNVILTPHISGSTDHYDERAVELFAENLHRYLAGLPLFNRIDVERGY
jgi:phosphoglycerate dehydrogenase-like enzyme